jgi:hypothetical protein
MEGAFGDHDGAADEIGNGARDPSGGLDGQGGRRCFAA